MSRWRRRGLPPAVASELALSDGERVMGFADPPTGWLVATDRALHGPTLPHGRVPWTDVDTARWDRDSQRLGLVLTAPAGQAARRVWIGLPEPSGLLDVIRERVTACVVLSRRVDVSGRKGFTVVARRPAWDRSAPLRWSVSVDPGLDPQSPELAEAVSQAMQEARADLGG